MSEEGGAAALPLPLAEIPPEVVAVADYEAFARDRMTASAWAYMSGGSADEITLRENRQAFQRLRLVPRVLRDVANGDTRLTLFGRTLDYPILLAPVAFQSLCHPDGELATALGASAMRATMIVSTQSSQPLEAVAQQAQSPLWFQLYIQPDRAFNGELVRRAEEAGYQALVLTVDAPVNGLRNREQRAGFALPAGVEAVNLRAMRAAPPHVARAGQSALFGGPLLDAAPTWRDLAWLKSATRLPIVLKGILSPLDAALAVEHGADALIVSNHGGRTLDTALATIEALPAIVDAVAGRIPVLLDGGVRRGTDIFKALALGASAVLIGRPYIHGLAAAGPVGVVHVLHLLRTELEVAMVLSGCRSLQAISADLVRPAGNVSC